ncbi:MAG: thiolase family protein [Acidaminobacteraceae bacterium]
MCLKVQPKVYIKKTIRTPIGKTNGVFKHLLAEDLFAQLLSHVLTSEFNSPNDIDEIIAGTAVGVGGNPARYSALMAGLLNTPSFSVDYQCGSGLKSIELGYSYIKAGLRDIVVCGGFESTSLEVRKELNKSDPRYEDYKGILSKAPFAPSNIGDPSMLDAAEASAKHMAYRKEELDMIALNSHKKAVIARDSGKLKSHILSIEVDGQRVDYDETIRDKMNMRLLSRMKPLTQNGRIITAGNACLKHDGAALVILCSDEGLKKLKSMNVEGEILGFKSIALNPIYSPLGAYKSVAGLLKDENLIVDDISAFEVNEAFALKTHSLTKELSIEKEKINKLGGALAYGHPYGASGAIIMTHLIASLEDKELGICTMGVAGGQGIAALVRRCNYAY